MGIRIIRGLLLQQIRYIEQFKIHRAILVNKTPPKRCFFQGIELAHLSTFLFVDLGLVASAGESA